MSSREEAAAWSFEKEGVVNVMYVPFTAVHVTFSQSDLSNWSRASCFKSHDAQ